jgi:aminoglycoside phosphotransferase (APT) family kinase protein
MPLPTARDPEEMRKRLRAWLMRVLPAGAAPEVSEVRAPSGTGMSSETLLFDASWREKGTAQGGSFVARMSPDMTRFPVFPNYDLELQWRCMDLVRRKSDVPVPRTRWLELDPSHLGSAFFVMERVEGRVPPDMLPYVFGSWVTEATPAERTALERNSVEILAKLHAIDVSGPDAAFLKRPKYGTTPLDQHLAYQREYYDWAREGERWPLVERCFEWLRDHRPADEGLTCLNWGDSRIGNMLYQGVTPVAVLDWEMAALGAPEVDLAWMIFMHEYFRALGEVAGVAGVPDFMVRDRVAKTYEGFSGRRVRHLDYYEVFAALRYAIVSIRTTARAISMGQMPEPAEREDRLMIRQHLLRMLSGEYWK